ncbi:MAG: hypothetical protein UZ04_CHB001001474 [Chlorobi bacterium OLB4]|jgi:hypothetical protein|nr:MAG: hypothetical protein UZ04_CHB001001474 [Chlorobi bacterium OLB4]RIK47808.1 MAG: hypothetical protein DCC60_09550 [Ignavibacteriota bacterium]
MEKNTYKFKQDISELRKLKVADKEKYKEMFQSVMKSYKISQVTLYRAMKSERPGIRKRRSDFGSEKDPVTASEKSLVTEVMLSGKTKKQAVKIASEKTGRKITGHKAAKIKPDQDIDESQFAEGIKKFINEILEIDLIAPEAGLYFKHKGVAFKVEKDYIEDIALVLCTAYNESLGSSFMRVDREQLMKSQIFHLVQEAIRVAGTRFDMKLVLQLTRMYKDLKSNSMIEVNPDFDTVYKCLQEVKPDVTKSEVISLIKKHAHG